MGPINKEVSCFCNTLHGLKSSLLISVSTCLNFHQSHPVKLVVLPLKSSPNFKLSLKTLLEIYKLPIMLTIFIGGNKCEVGQHVGGTHCGVKWLSGPV